MKNRDVHIVLAFPDNIADLDGIGSLNLELEVDIRQEQGWEGEVQYGFAELLMNKRLGHRQKLSAKVKVAILPQFCLSGKK